MANSVPNRVETRRIELHEKLVDILGTTGKKESRVYYQPPETVKMKYPAIVYRKDGGRIFHADDRSYMWGQRYTVTVIDADPDSDIASRIVLAFPKCSIDRSFTSDNLNHDVMTLYY